MSARTWTLGAAAATGVGVLLLAPGVAAAPTRAVFAWHAAFVYAWTLAIGLLAWVLIHHLTASSWFIVLRRTAEHGASSLPLLALLFLPAATSPGTLFPWVDPAAAPPHVREAVERAAAYLDPGFFLVRAGLFFAVWLVLAGLLRRASRAQEGGGRGDALASRMRTVSAAGIVPFALATHFAAVDWVMSLEPAWTSSVFGVYVFAGGLVGALALVTLASAVLARGPLDGVVTVSHFHGLGKLLFTLVCFWAYIAFFQFFIVWIGNEPSEVAWYVPRVEGAWRPWALALVGGHFLLPFFALLSRPLKRQPAALAVVAAWLLVWHAVDVYWMVMPAHAPHDGAPRPVDLGAFLVVGGTVLAFTLWRARGAGASARGDPRFARSVAFETE